MKINKTTLGLMALGMICASTTVLASDLQAWAGQTAQGDNPIEVIFAGKVYKNVSWVGPESCPLTNSGPQYSGKPWLPVGDASKEDMENIGNPTTCSTEDTAEDSKKDLFNASRSYNKDETIVVDNVDYRAMQDIPAYSYAPGEVNPWEVYGVTKAWQADTPTVGGHKVVRNSIIYKAKWWTQADPDNETTKEKTWIKVGPAPTAADIEANRKAALDIVPGNLYKEGSVIKVNNVYYVSLRDVKDVKPLAPNLWKPFVNWEKAKTKELVGEAKNQWPAHVYAPYVDFTAYGPSIPNLAQMAKNHGVTHFTLAFLVAKNDHTCVPTWGTSYNAANYEQLAQIKALRAVGGDVMISIGGASNSPMSTACTDEKDLMEQYSAIVDNYNLKALDFDIEGDASRNKESYARRNSAIQKLQKKWANEGRDIKIWYTLAVLPSGLTDAKDVLIDAQKKGVKLAGVNVMTMDYGDKTICAASEPGALNQGKCARDAIENLFTQVREIGLFGKMTDEQVYERLGTTPMIGFNDTPIEITYPEDAEFIMKHAKERNLGMIGIWSLGRDKPGPARQVEPNHSGMTEGQAPQYAYSKIFAPFTNISSVELTKHLPSADAGASQVMSKSGTVTLNGSRSIGNSSSEVLNYQWKQTSGEPVVLTGANSEKATFTVDTQKQAGKLTFELTVTNVEKNSDTSSVSVQLFDKDNAPAPLIQLQHSYQAEVGHKVNIRALVKDIAGTDNNSTYEWSLPDEIVVTDLNSTILNFTAPDVAGDYGMSFTVTNNDTGKSATSNTVLVVKAADISKILPWDPLATYGADFKCKPVLYKGKVWYNATWANGSNIPGKLGPDGKVDQYAAWRADWTKISGCN